MITLSLADVTAAVGGRPAGGVDARAIVTAVATDSRQVTPGTLFAALPGSRVDGHSFAAAALAAGAVAVLGTREVDGPALVVDDALVALGQLARAVVDRIAGLQIVGITGSSGKTSTKDLVAHLLTAVGATIAPPGSFNNELGLPLTALRCTAGTRFLVAEMGAREPGNIAYLCGITPPRIAVVLNVGAAHAGVFGSREVTARTKGELVAALPGDGVAVLNADDPLVRAMAPATGPRVVLVGRSSDAQVRAEDVRLDEQARPAFRLVTPGGAAEVALRLHGEHHVANALAAAAVGLEAGLDVDAVAELLGTAEPASRWRMDVQTRADGLTVVNDAYNANPDSMRAALEALAAMARLTASRGPRRTVAVLGEMLELGESAPAEHEAVGRLAARLGVSLVVAVGADAAEQIRAGAAGEAGWHGEACRVPDVDAALELLSAAARPGDLVLVKASRAVGLEAIAERLLAGRPEVPADQPVDPPGPPVPDALTGARGAGEATP